MTEGSQGALSPQQRALMQRLLRKKGVKATTPEAIPRRAPDAGPAPLSYAQQRMWVLQRLSPSSPFYNVPGALRLQGALSPRALEVALHEVARRHEVLRTAFPLVAGQPVQRVETLAWVERHLPLAVVQVVGIAEPWTEVRHLARREAQRPFDLERGPLLRAHLLRVDDQDHVLLLTFHHIITDAWSNGIVVRELATAYARSLDGEPKTDGARLPDPPLQYSDFAAWQRHAENQPDRERQLTYWRERLGQAHALDLPTDHARPLRLSARGLRVPVEIPAALRDRVDIVGRDFRATRFMVLLAAFSALLHRLSQQSPITIGSPVANRNRAELENLVGFFANTVALRLQVDASASFASLLEHSRDVAHGAFAHQDLPFEELVRELQPERDLSRNPLFQVMFVLQNAPPPSIPVGTTRREPLHLTSLRLDPGTAKFDLLLDLDDEPDRLRGALEISLDLFDPTTGRRWVEMLVRLLETAVTAPQTALRDLDFLRPVERHQLTREWSGEGSRQESREARTRSGAGTSTQLHDLFSRTARALPHAIAAVDGRRHLSYEALWRHSRERAEELHAQIPSRAGRERLFGVELERGLAQVTAMLACLIAGGAYVPIDPALPARRREAMRQWLEAQNKKLDTADQPGPVPANPQQLAYVVFTSGSTGEPKGVALPHAALVNLFEWHIGRSRVARPRTLAFSALGFDAALHEAFTTWGAGGTLILVREDKRRDPSWILRWSQQQAVERWFLPFVALDSLAQTAARHPGASNTGRPTALREVVTAGEQLRLSSEVRDFFVGLPADAVLENHYGPSETHVVSAHRLVARQLDDPRVAPDLPAIGRPVEGCILRVVDRHGRLLPIGAAGELCIGGVALARGYLGQPGRTAERFRPDPWHQTTREPSGRLYLSGDLVRTASDGALHFLGRLDRQVKIRGFRVEPAEVEAVLAAHPEVEQAAVAVQVGATSADTYLVGYVVSKDTSNASQQGWIEQLHSWIASRLSDYLRPRQLHVLDALPLTATGKVRRDALAASRTTPTSEPTEPPPGPRAQTNDPQLALQTALLRGLWAEVLDVEAESVSSDQDFFRAGGHSLSAVRLLARVHDVFGKDLPLAALFEAPTPGALAVSLTEAEYASSKPTVDALRPGLAGETAPVSFAQRRLWRLQQQRPDSAAYHLPIALRLRGQLDVRRLRQALARVAERHDLLRSVFTTDSASPDEPLLRNLSTLRTLRTLSPDQAPWGDGLPGVLPGVLPVALPVVDLEALARPAAQPTASQRLVQHALHRPFDLEREVPWRALLLRSKGDEHILVLVLHHIAGDAWSLSIWAREIAAAYAGISLPPLPLQYADYTTWQRRRFEADDDKGRRDLEWWRDQLTPLPTRLRLPWDRPPAARRADDRAPARAGLEQLQLGSDEAAALQRLAHQHSATLFIVLAAAWKILLARAHGPTDPARSQGHDISVGIAMGGRPRRQLEGLIGLFVETLVLRTRLDDMSVADLLTRMRRALLELHAHGDVPLDLLVRRFVPAEVAAQRRQDASPLFQTLLTLQNAPSAEMTSLPGLQVLPLASDTLDGSSLALPGVKADLVLSAVPHEHGLQLDLEYHQERFDRTTARRLLRHLRRLLRAFVEHGEHQISALPLLEPAQRHQVLSEWSAPIASAAMKLEAADGATIPARFLRVARCRSDAIAVVEGRRHVSYGELVLRVRERHRRLRPRLDRLQEPIVAVSALRLTEWLVDVLGLLLAGTAYLPLDPSWPEARRRGLLRQTGATEIETLLGDGSVESQQDEERLSTYEATAYARSLAYLIATSGSTGEPKAVAVSHGSVLSLVETTPALAVEPGDRVAQAASTTFDAATYEIWGALLSGACLCRIEREVTLDPVRLAKHLVRQRIDVLFLTTALFNSTIRRSAVLGIRPFEDLRILLFGGEAVDPAIVSQLLATAPPRTLLHVYGPTENTTFSTWWRVRPSGLGPSTIPIGHAVGDAGVLVLDDTFRPVAPGFPGQIYLDGDGLARGYQQRPALTASAFLPHPHASTEGARLYRTGDVVRQRPDGAIEFLGRVDRQIKLRGLRIELGEIEAALTALPEIVQAAVEVRSQQLLAWLTASSAEHPDSQTLRRSLQEHLPDYMVPSAFTWLTTLPLTDGGKVDRRALALLEPSMSGASNEAAQEDETGPLPEATDVQLMLSLWASVLGRPEATLRPQQDFFSLGGHSLLVAELLQRIRQAFDVELPLSALFENPTIDQLTRRVRASSTEEGLPPVTSTLYRHPTASGAILDAAPLSFAQERAWARWQRLTDKQRRTDAYYNIPQALQLRGHLDVARLHTALATITQRHEPLRTTFGVLDVDGADVPQQLIHPATCPAVPVVDLRRFDQDQPHPLQDLVRQCARAAFDLEAGPLWRCLLLRIDDAVHIFVLVLHHSVADGASLGLLTQELEAGYANDSAGSPPSSTPTAPALRYADYARWQQRYRGGEALKERLDFWRRRLTTQDATSAALHSAALPAPALPLPYDRPPTPDNAHDLRGGSVDVELPADLASRLARWNLPPDDPDSPSRHSGFTPFMLLLAAFAAFLHRITAPAAQDFTIGIPAAGRDRPEVAELIGFFVHVQVVRVEIERLAQEGEAKPTFEQLAVQIRQRALEAQRHQDVPFQRLAEAAAGNRQPPPPLFRVMFALQNLDLRSPRLADLEVQPVAVDDPTRGDSLAKFDLTLSMLPMTLTDGTTRYRAQLEYRSAVFDRVTVEGLAQQFAVLLESALASGQRCLDELPLLHSAEEA